MAASLTRLARSAPLNPRRLLRYELQVHVLGDRLALDVYLQDLPPAHGVRVVEHHAAVEPARPQQRRVEDVGPVGGREDDHVDAGVEAVHLDEYLVQRLLSLVVAAAEAGAAMAADRVDLVHEHDARGVALRLVEQVPDAGGADADEHLHELAAADGEEGHAGLARDGARQQCLPGPRRADEQHAAGDARAQRQEPLRVLEEVDDLLELHLGFINARDVGEGHGGLVADQHAGAAAAEAEGLARVALGLPHHEQQHHAEEDER